MPFDSGPRNLASYEELHERLVSKAEAIGTWGNGNDPGQTASITVEIPEELCGEEGTGRFTGGGHQILVAEMTVTGSQANQGRGGRRVNGQRVTRGLTIHCDLLLSNNLQVNWPVGNHFHMTDHMSTVSCTDDPEINQTPPRAPLTRAR